VEMSLVAATGESRVHPCERMRAGTGHGGGTKHVLEKEALNFILQDMPESIISAMFCYVFLDLRFRWKAIFVIAVIVSLANMVEVLPLAVGIRTILLILANTVCIRVFTGKDLSKVFVAVFVLFLLYFIADFALGVSMMRALGMDYAHAYNTPYLRALFSYPTLIVTLLATYYMYRWKKRKMVVFE